MYRSQKSVEGVGYVTGFREESLSLDLEDAFETS